MWKWISKLCDNLCHLDISKAFDDKYNYNEEKLANFFTFNLVHLTFRVKEIKRMNNNISVQNMADYFSLMILYVFVDFKT